jgi:preprotein translocase subunit SecG
LGKYQNGELLAKKWSELTLREKLTKATAIIAGLFVMIILIATLFGGGEREGAEEQAVLTVQNYGQNIGGNETIISAFSTMMTAGEATGIQIDFIGWAAQNLYGNVWEVYVEWYEYGSYQKISWRVNLDTGYVTPLDDFASTLKESAELW